MAEPAAEGAGASSGGARARSAARLSCVQALYEMEIAGTDLSDVLASRAAGTVGREVDGAELTAPDLAFLTDLATGVVREQARLDPEIDACLSEGWTLGRLDAILRAILRAGAFELSRRPDVPFKATISEYVDVAHAFFDGPETKVVNAVLDRLARQYGRTDGV